MLVPTQLLHSAYIHTIALRLCLVCENCFYYKEFVLGFFEFARIIKYTRYFRLIYLHGFQETANKLNIKL